MIDPDALLKDTVAIPSVSGREREVAEYLVGKMRTFADEARIDEAGNAVARLGHGELQVYFLGHIDTVPGEIPVRVEEGALWGRGSVDAKGSFCAAVAAAALLPSEVLKRLRVTLIGAVEEEAPSSKGARYALEAYGVPDLLIIGEPSAWDAVTLGYKGRLVVRLGLEQHHFHSAGEGSSAADEVVRAYQQIRDYAQERNASVNGIFDTLQVSLQEIHSHTDGLEQRCYATVGFRLPPAISPDALKAALEARITEVSVSFQGAEVAYRGGRDTPLTRAFRVAIRQQGGKPKLKLKTGTSDMNVVATHWQVPMLAYGPGDSGLDHTPQERLELAEYHRAIGVLRSALEKLAKSHG